MKTLSQQCLKPIFENTVLFLLDRIPDIDDYLNSVEYQKSEYGTRAKEYCKLINGLEVVTKRLKVLESNARIKEQLAHE